MTKEQVKFILGVYGENQDGGQYTALLNNMMIMVTKETNLYTDDERWRYWFDMSNCILKQVMVRRVDHIPAYGEIAGTVEEPIYYEFVQDKPGHFITNYFDFDKIIMFVPQTSKITTTDATNAIALAYGGGE